MPQMFPSHESAVTRGLSPRLWNLVPLDEIFGGPTKLDVGYGIFEDFLSVATDTTDTMLHLRSGGAEYFIDTNATILQLGGNETSSAMPGFGGVLRLSLTSDPDNDECGFQLCGAGGEPFFVSDTAANARDLIFECRFRTSTITASQLTFFIGLAECGMMAADTFLSTADPPVPGSLAHIGFLRNEDDPTYGVFAHGANGQTAQKTTDFLETTVSTTLVADTYYRFGFHFNAGRMVITPYWNGVPYTDDNITSTAGAFAATVPDGEGMSPMVVCRAAADGITATLDIDWIACAQVEAVG